MNGLKDILERLKIEQLNPMQEASVEAFNKGGEDLILLSPTGSGKTLAFLPVIKHVVAELRHLFERKHIVMNFCLLQANHIRLVLFDDGFKLVRSGAQAVDIKRDKFHSRCHLFR